MRGVVLGRDDEGMLLPNRWDSLLWRKVPHGISVMTYSLVAHMLNSSTCRGLPARDDQL
jgi:hypothetical protein